MAAMMMAMLKLLTTLVCVCHFCDVAIGTMMSAAERKALKEDAREMFFHAYHAYMRHAYPADELMPLSCRGRFRDTEPSRGDIDDALGNFSLTLVDTLDTLVVMGDVDEFENAVALVVRDVSFDHDIVVSVFETNIRMLGGLLSGHLLAGYLQEKAARLPWYKGELLTLARDLGFRLLPAFNTSTGVPHPRINLRHGMKSPKLASSRETCTACAGTMILELAALSRLTGETIFEEKAHKAMDYLWRLRHRTSDLMGTVLNIHNGDWVRRDSGVGAGIDSYYEYLLKAYILLGDYTYLERFNTHYSAVMKYISQGPMLVDVHMHRPHTNSRNFMDALLAFWPGLQVLKGDIKPAIETHEMLYQVMQRHNFLPEAFTTDFQVHWGQHPLRPEFLESTYFLHRATGDPYYLEAGRSVLESLQKHARVPCGFAAVKDVRTGTHEDRMDSFVLAETFKYLYLLFAEREDLLIDMDDFLFTTEAHLFPLTLARLSNATVVPQPPGMADEEDSGEDRDRTCPNTNYLFPGNKDFAHAIRSSLKNLVEGVCPKHRTSKKYAIHSQRQLRANEFQAGNEDHIRLLRKMGISIMALADGRVQLLHTTTHADSSEDAEEGLLFMQEMIELSESQSKQLTQQPRTLTFSVPREDGSDNKVVINAGPAQFGPEAIPRIEVTGQVVAALPLKCCSELLNGGDVKNKVVLMERGDCMFVDKARRIQNAGAIAGIVIDNVAGSSSASSPMFAMSGDGKNDVTIPVVFLFSEDATVLLEALVMHPNLRITISDVAEVAEDATAKQPESSESASDVTTYRETGEGEVTYVKVDIGQALAGAAAAADRPDELRRNVVELRLDSLSPTTFPGSATPVDIEPHAATHARAQTTATSTGSEGVVDEKRPRSSRTDVDSIMTLLNREKEYVLTLQKLIETALGDKKDIDGNTKVLLDRLSEFMRPKDLSPEPKLQLQPPQESDSEGAGTDQGHASPSVPHNSTETSPEDGVAQPRDEL